MALAAYPPSADIAFMSACIPAPPLQSEPAIVNTQLYFFIISVILNFNTKIVIIFVWVSFRG